MAPILSAASSIVLGMMICVLVSLFKFDFDISFFDDKSITIPLKNKFPVPIDFEEMTKVESPDGIVGSGKTKFPYRNKVVSANEIVHSTLFASNFVLRNS